MTATQTEVSCPKCGGRMWDNRADKKNPKAPDFKCRDRSCDGVIWPPRGKQALKNIPGNAPWEEEQEQAERTFVDKALTHDQMKTEALNSLIGAYGICWSNAARLAKELPKDVVITADAVSSMAATMFIQAASKGLI